jgi:hypothetical protein
MSGVQRSAKSSAPLATGQNCPYPPMSRHWRSSSSAASSKSGLLDSDVGLARSAVIVRPRFVPQPQTYSVPAAGDATRTGGPGDAQGLGWVALPLHGDSREMLWHDGGTGGFRRFVGFVSSFVGFVKFVGFIKESEAAVAVLSKLLALGRRDRLPNFRSNQSGLAHVALVRRTPSEQRHVEECLAPLKWTLTIFSPRTGPEHKRNLARLERQGSRTLRLFPTRALAEPPRAR